MTAKPQRRFDSDAELAMKAINKLKPLAVELNDLLCGKESDLGSVFSKITQNQLFLKMNNYDSKGSLEFKGFRSCKEKMIEAQLIPGEGCLPKCREDIVRMFILEYVISTAILFVRNDVDFLNGANVTMQDIKAIKNNLRKLYGLMNRHQGLYMSSQYKQFLLQALLEDMVKADFQSPYNIQRSHPQMCRQIMAKAVTELLIMNFLELGICLLDKFIIDVVDKLLLDFFDSKMDMRELNIKKIRDSVEEDIAFRKLTVQEIVGQYLHKSFKSWA